MCNPDLRSRRLPQHRLLCIYYLLSVTVFPDTPKTFIIFIFFLVVVQNHYILPLRCCMNSVQTLDINSFSDIRFTCSLVYLSFHFIDSCCVQHIVQYCAFLVSKPKFLWAIKNGTAKPLWRGFLPMAHPELWPYLLSLSRYSGLGEITVSVRFFCIWETNSLTATWQTDCPFPICLPVPGRERVCHMLGISFQLCLTHLWVCFYVSMIVLLLIKLYSEI